MTIPSTFTGPVALTDADAETVRSDIERRREHLRRWLRESSTSYLAAAERRDFGARETLVVGTAADADIRLADPALAPRHVSVTALPDGFRIRALDAAGRFRIAGEERSEATIGPGVVELGRFALRLSHQGFPAIVVLDPARLRHARGELRFFPVDLAYRFVAPLTGASVVDEVTIVSTRGNERRALRVGWFELAIAGVPCRVEATRLLEPGVGEHAYGVYFRDRTTGVETYGVGRYLDPEPLGDGTYLVDFNLAYNPACAFSPHYNCPIPTREGDLPVAIRAGEMTPADVH